MMPYSGEICFIGSNEVLSTFFRKKGYLVSQFGRNSEPPINFCGESYKSEVIGIANSEAHSHYLICAGLLQSVPIVEQTSSQICDSFLVNAAGPVITSELLLTHDPKARIIILGSESAKKGSFDLSYALSKSSLSTYIRNKRVGKSQQLILLSPSTVEDLGMTLRRKDQERVSKYRSEHPKERFIKGSELALLIYNLFQSSIYLTNTEIEINGGKFASMI